MDPRFIRLGMQVTFRKRKTTGLKCIACARDTSMFAGIACAACSTPAIACSACTPTDRCASCARDSEKLQQLNQLQTFMGYTTQYDTKCEVWRCLACNNDIVFQQLDVRGYEHIRLRVIASNYHQYVCEPFRSGRLSF